MKRALIIGCLGQDGKLLYEYLLKKKYQVIGIDVNHIKASYKYSGRTVDITQKNQVFRLICATRPSEVYHLAAFHHSSEDDTHNGNYELFRKSFDINTFSLIYFLEALRKHVPKGRLFYAASSHIFGNNPDTVDDENSSVDPFSIYGITKAAGVFICRYYRKEYSMFASCGILYNHESVLRTDNFISKKIIKTAIGIKEKRQEELVLGNIRAEADWGYAPDYVDAMYRILRLKQSDDFIIATGKRHSVAEFAGIAFQYLGLDWRRYVQQNRDILTRKSFCRIGNAGKLRSKTGWKPSVDFKEMIKVLLMQEAKVRIRG